MEEIKIINKSTLLGKEIDVWGAIENPLFRASDVADWLHNSNVSDTLGITARKLNTLLSDNRIIYKQSGQWHLHMSYKGWNLASDRTHLYAKTEDKFGTSLQLVWNQRGKRFIIALFNNNFNVRSAIKEIRGEMQAASLAISQTKVDIYNI